MKDPADYLPPPLDTPEGPVVHHEDALAALADALADAENYKCLLLRAVRNSTPSQPLNHDQH